MFVDLVGSTALAARLDPEDMREVIGTYHRCVAETVGRFGGFVAKYMGDGVLVYFGWPQADEADAERAVRAALATLEAVGQIAPAGERLAARIGIASGLAVVGDLLGAGAAQEQTVIGETPNLAARLQSLADPGCAVIDAETRRRIGGLFECRELGAFISKGCLALCAPGRCWARPWFRAASRPCTRPPSRRWSGAMTSSICCCAAGGRQRTAKGRWCSSPASPASASPA